MFRNIALAFVLVSLFGCTKQPLVHSYKSISKTQEQARTMLIGRWYGDEVALDGKRTQQLCENRSDGSFTLIFRVTDKAGKWAEHKEVGVWGVSGKIYFTITTALIDDEHVYEVKPGTPNFSDAYEIIKLTPTTFRSKAQGSDDDFTETKVDDSFEFSAA